MTGGDSSPPPASSQTMSMRIYIGGVSSGVSEADIEKTFSSLGAVAGVELVRTNGRSFAYMDFQPNSDKALAKLFSTYNGCTWKGGKLKLEKAKEHYLSRLKREWEEDAKLASVKPVEAVEPKAEHDVTNLKLERLKMEDMHLRIFFPKLRKVKPLPYKGSGKHKYSFQRVEVPSLPIHFCDCEEHMEQSEAASKQFLTSVKTGVFYEKELNIMNSVMDKLLKKGDKETTGHKETTLTTDAHVPESDDIALEEDIVSDMDEDNIVMNIGKGARDDELMQLARANILSANQKSVADRTQASTDGSNQKRANPKKRKKIDLTDTSEVATNSKDHLSEEDKITEDEFSAILPRKKSCTQEPESFSEPPKENQTEPSTDNLQYARGNSWLQKSSWRDLVGQVANSTFSITNVLPEISLIIPKPQSNNTIIPTTDDKVKKPETKPETEKPKPQEVTKDTIPEENQVLDVKKEQPQRTNKPVVRRAIPKVGISQTCTFMRSAESEKEWAKAKTALSGYIKKKEKKLNEKDGSKLFRRN